MPKSGKEEAAKMMDTLLSTAPMLNVSSMQGGSNFMSQVWWWGNGPGLQVVEATPKGASLLNIVFTGDVKVVMFELSS